MDYKKAFYSKLEECYLGAKIKAYEKAHTAQNTQSSTSNAQSGFSNLLSIKEQYFSHIKAYLDSAIPNDDFNSHDIYNKLYTFFDSYLNDTGTPFFHDTPLYKNIYAKVYTNSKDTSLFYKTKDLYYVKSDTLYTSLTLSDENELAQIYFDTSEYTQNADNTKRKLIFKLDKIEQTSTDTQDSIPTIYIKVLSQKDLLPKLNAVFKENSNELSEDFIKSLKAHKIPLDEAHIKKLVASYKKQNEVDFFIHKNARAFLQEQFDLWFYHYLYKDSEFQEWSVKSISHLQRIRNIALEIIGLIGDFEDELKAVWLKPKFVKAVNYVFSLDLILRHSVLSDKAQNTALLDSICKDKGFEKQIKEWQDLGLIDESFQAQNISEKILSDDKYKFLPLDTKHFSKEIKYKILSVFDDIESILNGELIKADNFQALHSLMPKYQNKVDLIYIDPPYNTGNDGFIYSDKFNHSSWLSMIANRLELAREFLKDSGSIFISIDDNEQARLKILCDSMFGEENFVSNVIWRKRAGGGNDSSHIANEQEYLCFYAKNADTLVTNGVIRPSISKYKQDDKGFYIEKPLNDTALQDSVGLHYDIKLPNGKILKGNEHQWKMSESTFLARLERNEIIFKSNNKVYYKHYIDISSNLVPSSIWYDLVLNADATQEIKSLFGDKAFDTPKPERLLKRICEIASNEDSIILDFFAGSGTSVATAQKLGRKWLGIEMGEHFYKVIIPRLKKVIAGFQSGISKECDYQGGGAFRYYELESYEEALKECEYVLIDFQCENKTGKEIGNNIEAIYPAKDYQKAQKIIDYRKSRKLIKKLNKGETITLDMSGYRKEFDLFHTLANLQGLKIKRLFLDSKGIESCEFDNGDIVSLEKIDLHTYPKLKSLIWW
ncbi:site-specific DNA-methyltransferase [Helicobacter cinaedi]|uniref:site-specific DNA-methyltransferase n=1 Tax=Helicobacter cinaedi TaxID=213 RepID=UPI000CF0DA82|nr:site-specific DNA-methyltransferase [Helicobacter cinaedi]